MTTITKETLFKWQDIALEASKRQLQSEKRLPAMLIVLAIDNLVDPSFMQGAVAMGKSAGRTFAEVAKGATCELMIPLMLPSPAAQLSLIRKRIPEDKRDGFDRFIESSPEFAKLIGLDGSNMELVHHHVCRALRRAMGLENDKDIVALLIADILERTHALAYLHIMEAYMLMEKGKTEEEMKAGYERTGSLRDVPGSQEAIFIMMESAKVTRSVWQPFERTVRDTGKVKSFGERVIYGGEEGRMVGRFAGLLRRAEEMT